MFPAVLGPLKSDVPVHPFIIQYALHQLLSTIIILLHAKSRRIFPVVSLHFVEVLLLYNHFLFRLTDSNDR